MTGLCKYKHIFGVENTGVHQYRLFGIAVVDLIATILGVAIIYYFTGFNFWILLFIAILSGIVLHRLFCVNTTINKLIFGEI